MKNLNKISFLLLKFVAFLKCLLIRDFQKKVNTLLKNIDLLEVSTSLNINSDLVRVIIYIEDRRFFKHFGHDIWSIIRAFIHNIAKKDLHGASTIEQQLIRLLTNKREKTYRRKLNEILLSAVLHSKYSKERILKLYLEYYYFSEYKIGLRAFCAQENYDFNTLSKTDICEIVARLKYPNLTSRNYIKYLKRVRTIEQKYAIVQLLPSPHLQRT